MDPSLIFISANLSVLVQRLLPSPAVIFLPELLATLGISRRLGSGSIYILYRL
jgi:hypothetical protein